MFANLLIFILLNAQDKCHHYFESENAEKQLIKGYTLDGDISVTVIIVACMLSLLLEYWGFAMIVLIYF